MHTVNPISDKVPALNKINFRVFFIVLDSDISLIAGLEAATSSVEVSISSDKVTISSVEASTSSVEAASSSVEAATSSVKVTISSDKVTISSVTVTISPSVGVVKSMGVAPGAREKSWSTNACF